MSLSRSSLTRRTPLKSKTTLRRTSLNRRAVKASSRRRDTGPSRDVRELVAVRAGGCCELCGISLIGEGFSSAHSFHHRRPRGMGGSKDSDTNTAANLLLLCGSGTTGCHGFVEANRAEAYSFGYLVRQGMDPALVPVARFGSSWALLAVDGTLSAVDR